MAAIKTNHPARKAIASLPTYVDHKGGAIYALDSALAPFGWVTECYDIPNNEGRALVPFVDDQGVVAGYISLSWHRMPSGRYEFTSYIT